MLDTRAEALVVSDVAFFALPPNRPPRSTRRTDGGEGRAHRLVRTIRRELRRAMDESGSVTLPRITNYPY